MAIHHWQPCFAISETGLTLDTQSSERFEQISPHREIENSHTQTAQFDRQPVVVVVATETQQQPVFLVDFFSFFRVRLDGTGIF